MIILPTPDPSFGPSVAHGGSMAQEEKFRVSVGHERKWKQSISQVCLVCGTLDPGYYLNNSSYL